MGLYKRIPFEEGQNVESRSFENGFRGAWFRSKISSISMKKIGWGFHLEFLDFPDEKNTWTKAYQNPYGRDKALKHMNREKKELMVRPPFPPVFLESQMPDVNTISEPIVVVNNAWKVGDLVDWWKDDCYWSGRITEITEDDKFQILLLAPPFGEGLAYEACSKDLRPTLQWSTTNGWTVPTPKDSENGYCARIINPIKQGKSKDGVRMWDSSAEVPIPGVRDGKGIVEDTVGASQTSSTSWTISQQPEHRLETQEQSTSSSALQALKENQASDMDHDHTEKASCPEHSSSSHSKYDTAAEAMHSPSSEKQASVSNGRREGSSGSREAGLAADEVGENPVEKDGLDDPTPSKKEKEKKKKNKKKEKKSRDVDEKMSLNSMFDDSIEASVLDLEELLARVKWMKGLLKSDNDSTRPPWKFIENRASSKRG